jgi:hypothetical protein
MLRRVQARRPDPLAAAYARFCAKLARRGVIRHATEGPVAFARRAGAVRPDLHKSIETICVLYARLRYGPVAPVAETRLLLEKINAFEA